MFGAIFPDSDVMRGWFDHNDMLIMTWHRSITHSLLCQYPVPDWDPALAATCGRESIAPRPQAMAPVRAPAAPPFYLI